VESTPVRKLN
jgi:Ca2+-binding EF-hand superfamily protein